MEFKRTSPLEKHNVYDDVTKQLENRCLEYVREQSSRAVVGLAVVGDKVRAFIVGVDQQFTPVWGVIPPNGSRDFIGIRKPESRRIWQAFEDAVGMQRGLVTRVAGTLPPSLHPSQNVQIAVPPPQISQPGPAYQQHALLPREDDIFERCVAYYGKLRRDQAQQKVNNHVHDIQHQSGLSRYDALRALAARKGISL